MIFSEKPNDEEWLSLNRMKIPLLLNYAQCKLLNKEYYAVIEHCTTVLKAEPGIKKFIRDSTLDRIKVTSIESSFFLFADNVKALYRRGKAYIGAWDERNAIRDLRKAAEIDLSLHNTVEKELQTFATIIKEKNSIQKEKLSKMFK